MADKVSVHTFPWIRKQALYFISADIKIASTQTLKFGWLNLGLRSQLFTLRTLMVRFDDALKTWKALTRHRLTVKPLGPSVSRPAQKLVSANFASCAFLPLCAPSGLSSQPPLIPPCKHPRLLDSRTSHTVFLEEAGHWHCLTTSRSIPLHDPLSSVMFAFTIAPALVCLNATDARLFEQRLRLSGQLHSLSHWCSGMCSFGWHDSWDDSPSTLPRHAFGSLVLSLFLLPFPLTYLLLVPPHVTVLLSVVSLAMLKLTPDALTCPWLARLPWLLLPGSSPCSGVLFVLPRSFLWCLRPCQHCHSCFSTPARQQHPTQFGSSLAICSACLGSASGARFGCPHLWLLHHSQGKPPLDEPQTWDILKNPTAQDGLRILQQQLEAHINSIPVAFGL